MGAIDKVLDDKVRKLANTLRSSGLAASDTEAIRMAKSMTNTESKVTRKESEFGKKDDSQDEMVQRETPRDEPRNVETVNQDLIDSTQEDLDLDKITVEQASQEEIQEPEDHEQTQDVITEEKPVEELEQDENDDFIVSEENEISEEVSYDLQEEKEQPLVNEESQEKEEELVIEDQTQEERAPPKKDISEFEESQVDLSDVFKFKP